MNLVVAGGGYVGLATAIGFARRGHEIDLVETDPARAALLRRRRLPFREPGMAGALAQLPAGRLRIHSGYARWPLARFSFICVGTSGGEDGRLDERDVEDAVRRLVEATPPNAPIVIRSTVNPGTTLRIEEALRAVGEGRAVLVNPEFLREGQALEDFESPERRLIGGTVAAACRALSALYGFGDAPMIETDPTSAELAKLSSNAALAVRVSLANELALVAERIGAQYLSPGIGFGGSCLPKDLEALRAVARDAVPPGVLDGALGINEAALQRAAERILDRMQALRPACVGVLGVAFKPGSDSVRHSPAVRLIERLLGAGLRVTVCDPAAEAAARARLGDAVSYARSLDELAATSDLIVIVHPGEGTASPGSGPPVVDVLGRPWPPARRSLAGT